MTDTVSRTEFGVCERIAATHERRVRRHRLGCVVPLTRIKVLAIES